MYLHHQMQKRNKVSAVWFLEGWTVDLRALVLSDPSVNESNQHQVFYFQQLFLLVFLCSSILLRADSCVDPSELELSLCLTLPRVLLLTSSSSSYASLSHTLPFLLEQIGKSVCEIKICTHTGSHTFSFCFVFWIPEMLFSYLQQNKNASFAQLLLRNFISWMSVMLFQLDSDCKIWLEEVRLGVPPKGAGVGGQRLASWVLSFCLVFIFNFSGLRLVEPHEHNEHCFWAITN